MDKNGYYESFKEIVEDNMPTKYSAYKQGFWTGFIIGIVLTLMFLSK